MKKRLVQRKDDLARWKILRTQNSPVSQCTYNALCIQVGKLYISTSTATPSTGAWRGWPFNSEAMIFSLLLYHHDSQCSNMLFSTYEKWYCIKARAELQTAFPSLPKPVLLFVNLTITKIQRSITQRLLISLFYFVSLIDTLQSSGLRQHNGSLETLSASQLGSWHLVTAPGCLFFSFQSKTAGEYLSVCWWQRTCSRTGCDSCCRSSFKTVALSKEAWQINKTKCKICFFSCW